MHPVLSTSIPPYSAPILYSINIISPPRTTDFDLLHHAPSHPFLPLLPPAPVSTLNQPPSPHAHIAAAYDSTRNHGAR